MVNFILQMGWVMVLGYVVKIYSRCFCGGIFWMRYI